MNVGQVVKFAHPADDAELAQRFAVVDDRGDRVLVRCINGFDDWSIKPEAVYLVSDLCSAS